MPDSIGRVKACTECRQQKVRCDAFKDYTRPCSRCRTAQLPCIISKDFQRRKRQSKAQMQYELDRLRGNMPEDTHNYETHSTGDTASTSPAKTTLKSRQDYSRQSQYDRANATSLSPSEQVLNEAHRSCDTSQSPALGTQYHTPASLDAASARPSEETLPRVLETVEISGQVIDDCYNLFLEKYARFLNGLFELKITPNERYSQCPTLFWAMVCVGSRRYTKDLGVFTKLEDPVLDLAFRSFRRPAQPLLVILAALVLCSWPMTIDYIYRDPSQALAGAAMNLAISQGLHMYCQEQDFVSKTHQKPTEPLPNAAATSSAMYKAIKMRDAALVFRTRVWAHCLSVFQSTSLCDGLPATSLVPCFRKTEVYGEMGSLLPDALAYRMRLWKIQTTATNVISDSCDLDGKNSQSHLNALIASFDDNICHLIMPQSNHLYHFLRAAARLSVLGLYFVAQLEPDHPSMAQLYSVIRELIDHAAALDADGTEYTCYMPLFHFRMTYYALHCLVRIYKSPLGKKLDKTEAGLSFQMGIDIIKYRSKYRNVDLSWHAITMLSQLWTSEKAFVRTDKVQNGLRVEVRHRLTLNPIFDNFWWWRQEFGPSAEPDQPLSSNSQVPTSADAGPTANGAMENAAFGPASATGPNGSGDNAMLESAVTGFTDWDFSVLPSDFYDLNAWLGGIDESGPLEYQPWELPTGLR